MCAVALTFMSPFQIYWRERAVRFDMAPVHSSCRVRRFLCTVLLFSNALFSRNVIENRYGLSELDASTKASYILAGSMFLYPTVRPSSHQMDNNLTKILGRLHHR